MKFLLPLLLICWACNSSPSGPSAPLQPIAPVQDGRPSVYLEGIYATSTATGHPVESLFDTDPGTYWQTRAGAGPDEGIMLYFVNPLVLGSIQLLPTEGSFAEQDTTASVAVYINGSLIGKGNPSARIALAGAEAAGALYVRFARTGREQARSTRKADAEVSISEFPASAAVGLQALRLFDGQQRELRLIPPQRISGTITASSSLAPVTAYGPEKLFDARKEFAWVEGNTAGNGVGEWLRCSFDQEVRITALRIWNGYQRSDEHLKANARVRSFSFGLQGTPGDLCNLPDQKASVLIRLPTPVSGRAVELNIREVYPGTKYKDLAISDLVFYDGDQPFVLENRASESAARQAPPSPLTTLLDRPVYNRIEEGDVVTSQSLILRSDGTFVLYQDETYGDDAGSQTLADGNWELLESNASSATVKIFGRWNNLSQLLEYYEGSTPQQVTSIFSDRLTIDATTVTGQKMAGRFWLK